MGFGTSAKKQAGTEVVIATHGINKTVRGKTWLFVWEPLASKNVPAWAVWRRKAA